jgi:hypothetical protein
MTDMPDGVLDLDPVIITSPLPRSGTTLLQRLLCSAPNTLIYGERAAQELEFFLNIHAYKMQEHAARREPNRRLLSSVLQGEVNDWILDLTPDTDGYLRALQQAAFAGIAYCRDFARVHDRPVWGFKYPAWSPVVLRILRRMLPRTRLLFITRDILPALRSAKAQHMIDTPQQLHELCQGWLSSLSYLAELAHDVSVMTVRYEDLVGQPEETLAAIATFSGAQQMDRSILEHRINTWRGQELAAQSGDGYVRPVELSEAEMRAVSQVMESPASSTGSIQPEEVPSHA